MRWEYFTLSVEGDCDGVLSGNEIESVLDNAGEDEWELVSSQIVRRGGYTQLLLILKRPLENEGEQTNLPKDA